MNIECIAVGCAVAALCGCGAAPRAARWESVVQNGSIAPDSPEALAQQLAERYAPVVYYACDEPNLPTNVERFLAKTELWYYDASCSPAAAPVERRVGPAIPRLRLLPCRPGDAPFDSWGTRSLGKQRSFFLRNVAEADRAGSRDSTQWTTYFHAYRNDLGGITVQYWRFYAFNTGEWWGHAAAAGSHGGDWEAIHIVLGAGPQYAPIEIRLLGHRDITSQPFSAAQVSGTHILIHAGKGGHTSYLLERGGAVGCWIRHESWSGGRVQWADGRTTAGGALVNLGQKTAPRPGMEFLRYSGLWGTRQAGGWFPAAQSGYWGPAFNETGMRRDGFISAWCAGSADPHQEAGDPADGKMRECYPSSVSR